MVRALIVDDDPVSARVVGKCLERAGHQVQIRHDGRAGLEAALADPPDLIILDVMMPGMDGLEVCSALREAEATREVPVIFVSACGELGDRVSGLDHGADDYLVKPVVPDDLLARVRAALRTKLLQDELHQALAELRQVGQNRQELVSMLAHDIRGLLGAVSSAVEMARLDIDDLAARDAHRFLGIAERNTTELVELTTNLLDSYRLEEGRLRPRVQSVDLADLVQDVVERLSCQVRHRNALLMVTGQADEDILADRDLLERVLVNLVTNALKFSPVGTTITIEIGSDLVPPGGSPGTVVAIRDEGPGISADDQEHLFERFTPLALPGGKRPVGSGLGLAFCHKVITLMGGEIWVESEPGFASTFAFVVPAAANGIRPYPERRTAVPSEPYAGEDRRRRASLTPVEAVPSRPAASIIPFRSERSSATR